MNEVTSIPEIPSARSLRSSGGNRVVQPKLEIGKPGDKYEQEADAIANKVMRMPPSDTMQMQAIKEEEETVQPKIQMQPIEEEEELLQPELQMQPIEEEEEEEPIQTKPIYNSITPLIQRQPEPEEEEEEVQPGYDQEPEDSTPILDSVPTRDVDELDEEEEEFVQTKSSTSTVPPVTPGISQDIQAIKGAGKALPASERAFFEPRFGSDFVNVRVHTGRHAAHTAQSINARAFTLGHDVVFGAGQYSPVTSSSRRLLAHELTHVVQQNNLSNLSRNMGPIALPPIPTLRMQGIVQRQPSKKKGFVGKGWIKEDLEKKKQAYRENLEKYTKKGTTESYRNKIKKSLSLKHLKFVNWIESSDGKDALALLKYIKNTNYSIKCWPSEKYPFEVTINGPLLTLWKSEYPWWDTHVDKLAKKLEPRVTDPKFYAYRASRNLLTTLEPQMKELLMRYSEKFSRFVKIKDKRLLSDQMSMTKPNKIEWKNLSDEMRDCWRAAVEKGKKKSLSAFINKANEKHNSILAGIKKVQEKISNNEHAYKNLWSKVVDMACDDTSAMYSYRTIIKPSLRDRSLFKVKRRWKRYWVPFE